MHDSPPTNQGVPHYEETTASGLSTSRRRRFIINPDVQLRFVGLLLLVAILTSFQLLIYILLIDVDVQQEAMKYGVNNPATISFVVVQQKALLMKMLFFLALNMAGMTFVALLFSHRISGPVYRIEQYFKQMSKGRNPGVFRIRKHDQFQEVATSINKAMNSLKDRNEAELQLLGMISQELADMKSNRDAGRAIQLIEELRAKKETFLNGEQKAPPKPDSTKH